MVVCKRLAVCWIVMSSSFFASGLSINNTEVPANTIESSTDTNENKIQANNTNPALLPPLIFPNDPGRYKVLELNDASPNNETAIKILLSRARENGDNAIGKDTLVDAKTDVKIITTAKPANNEPIKSDVAELDENLKNEVEEIQTPEEEVGLEELFHKQQSSNLQMNPVFAEDIETNSSSLHGGHITAIFIGVLAIVSMSIYVGLISWRSYLEKRYGMREQLVTEDDYYNNNDIRHFVL